MENLFTMAQGLLTWILTIVIIVGVYKVTTIIIQKINEHRELLIKQTDNETSKKYINLLSDTVTTCVLATNQILVNDLKENGEFTSEKMKLAFDTTYNAILSSLTPEAKAELTKIYGNLSDYIKKKIEAEVLIFKK